MFCPACKEQMIVLELNQVEIDYCYSCEGIWLDSGELELLLQQSNEKEKILSSLSFKVEFDEERIKCPICRKKMNKIKIDGPKPVILDKCVFGDGLWFDKDELYKILVSGMDEENILVKQFRSMFEYKFK